MSDFFPSLNLHASSRRRLGILGLITALAIAVPARLEDKDVMDKLILNPSLKTFVNLVAKAGLIETLKEDGPYTVFAPNDDAFAKVPAHVLNGLKKDPELLKKVLTYYMVESRIESRDLKAGTLDSILGEKAKVTGVKDGLRINGAKLISVDDKADNGIIHIVDTVFFPPSLAEQIAKL